MGIFKSTSTCAALIGAMILALGCSAEDGGSDPQRQQGKGGAGGNGGAAGNGGSSGGGSSGVGGFGGNAGNGGGLGAGGAGGNGGAGGSAGGAGGNGGNGGSDGGAGGTDGNGGSAGDGGSGGTGGDAGGTGGAGGTAGTGGTGGMHEDLGQGDPNDVITIGDSYMNLLTSGIQQSLERISGRNYRNYAFPGTLVLNEQIPNQYVQANSADGDIWTVVMTGGGNDVLNNSCTGTCQSVVDQVSARLAELMEQMGKDGVKDVIIVSYGYPTAENRRPALDYSRSLLPQSCKTTTTPRCHYIDPVNELQGKIAADGIHPTAEGYDILGRMVWELMKAQGIRR